ncbi:MAG TPA: SET domain-containing protein-lysine N-methyltransferase [Candidatus Acidoferrum sp.]|nr:SET domain-containing protein-lysine N-methyltransferase [Candidatus Acidoferrum sp.]
MRSRIDPKYARYKLRIARSRIHDAGVFAAEDIPAHRRVIEYTGKRLTFAQCADLKPPRDRYLVRLNDAWVLDGRAGGSGAELINHSCAPNVTFRPRAGHIFFVSVRKIRAGEELTVRYAYPVKIVRVPCRCGARNCRGTLRYILK